ncbi:MAG TPA: alpha-hydroxy acid oxidase [Streptosporangiaceae bacterium]
MFGRPSLKNVTCIEDLREIARRRVPRAYFQYADNGSYSQATLRANQAGLEAVRLRQRVGIDVSSRDLSTTIAGEPAALPVVLAPIGLCGLNIGDGEILACRAAHAAGIQFCLGTMSICSVEDLAAAVSGPFWFQLYLMRDRGFSRELIQRVIEARCSALVITLDLAVLAQRNCDIKNRMTVPPRLTARNALSFASRPAWAWSLRRSGRTGHGNLDGHIHGSEAMTTVAQWVSRQFDPSLSWADIDWIREIWPGKLIIKGITDVADAKIAAEHGAAAIVISNHGGRQLDGAPPTIAALPAIADAVGSDLEVMFDGGIRSGQDVLRALALGASSCMIGRAFVYGLGAAGQQGVARAIDIIRTELDVTMALTGTTSVRSVSPQVIAPRAAGSD